MEPTQAPPDGPEPRPDASVPPAADPGGAPEAWAEPPEEDEEPVASPAVPQRGLLAWVVLIGAGSMLCLLLGHAEVALLFAVAGVFALAQATDATAGLAPYRHWVGGALAAGTAPGRLVRLFVRGVVPGTGALAYLGIGTFAQQQGEDPAYRFAAAWCYIAAGISLLLIARPVADRVTLFLFRRRRLGRTRRLAARLVVIALMLPVPMQVLHVELLDAMREAPQPLADAGALATQLLGELAIALAGVGWLVRRRWRRTVERLGIGGLGLASTGVVLAGLVAVIGVNAGMEALQHSAFPELWGHDQEATRIIAADMPVWTALLLGVSAGVGEELMLRGALQPRLGILLTSVVFACGHVQYSWFGMTTIALLGVVLGLVRKQSNTTAAIAVHVLYDIFAVLTSRA